jgi:DNA-binding NarL/FixJ family response regulator
MGIQQSSNTPLGGTAPPAGTTRTKLLVVEDHDIIAVGLKAALQAAAPAGSAFDMVFAGSLAAAGELLDSSFSLVLLDLCLPDSEPHDCLGGLRMLYPRAQDIPIVIFSAVDSAALIREALGAGAAGFIPKRTKMAIVVAAIEIVLNGGIYLPPHLMPLLATLTEGERLENASPHLLTGFALTQRQQSVLALLLEGQSNKHIARSLGLSVGTVKNYVSALLKSTNVKTRSQILATLRHGSGTAGKS